MAERDEPAIEGDDLASIPSVADDRGETEKSGRSRKNGKQAARSWQEIDLAAVNFEKTTDKNITAIFTTAANKPDWWIGVRCECPVYMGDDAVRLHTSEVIPL